MYDNPLAGGNQRTIPELAAAMQPVPDKAGGDVILARRLHISTKNVKNYIDGTQQPGIETRRALAALCDQLFEDNFRNLAYWNAVCRGEKPPTSDAAR